MCGLYENDVESCPLEEKGQYQNSKESESATVGSRFFMVLASTF